MARHNRKTIINSSRNGSQENMLSLTSYPSVTSECTMAARQLSQQSNTKHRSE